MSRPVQLLKLLVGGGAVAAAWLIVLPWMARQPAERASWQVLQQSRIDPSAMYYTELEAMEPILQRLNARQAWQATASSENNFERPAYFVFPEEK